MSPNSKLLLPSGGGKLIPSSWRWPGLSDLLLTNTIEEKWRACLRRLGHKALWLSPLVDHSLCAELAAMCWGHSGTCRDAQVIRRRRPPASSQQGSEAASSHMKGSQLGSRFSSPSQTFRWRQPLCILTTGWQDTPEPEPPRNAVTHRPWAVISVCYFKPWSLGDNLSHSNR